MRRSYSKTGKHVWMSFTREKGVNRGLVANETMPDVGKHVETMNQRFKVCGQICSSTSKHVVSQPCYPIPIYIYVAQTAFLGQDLRILVWNFTMAHLWINACPSTTHFPNIAAKTIMFIKCLGPWIFPSESQSNRRPHCQEKKKRPPQ